MPRNFRNYRFISMLFLCLVLFGYGLRIPSLISKLNMTKTIIMTEAFHVASVEPGSPAEKSGIQVNDELVSINDFPIQNDFYFRTDEKKLSETKLVIKRNNETKVVGFIEGAYTHSLGGQLGIQVSNFRQEPFSFRKIVGEHFKYLFYIGDEASIWKNQRRLDTLARGISLVLVLLFGTLLVNKKIKREI